MKGQHRTQTLKIHRPPGTDEPQCACARTCMRASQRTRSVIIYCPVNLDLSTETDCLEQTQRCWNSRSFWNVWLALREGVGGLLSATFPWCKGCNERHVQSLCLQRCKNCSHTHINNRCYSMYPYVTSWLASYRAKLLHTCDPFFLYPHDSLSLIDFIALVNTLSVRRCDGDNSIIECLIGRWRMPSCCTNTEHASTWTHTQRHTHRL